jgi:hypothetical protein
MPNENIIKLAKLAKIAALSTAAVSISTQMIAYGLKPIPVEAASTPVQTCYLPTGNNPGTTVPATQDFRTDWGGAKLCNFKKFDRTLGKLTGITTTIDAMMKTDAQVENLNNGPTNISVQATANIVLTASTGEQLSVASPVVKTDAKPLGTYDGISDYGGTSGATYPSQPASDSKTSTVTTQSILDQFTGDGVQTIATTGKTTTVYTSQGSANVLMNANTYAAANVSISYNYQSPPIATPGTFSNVAVDGNVDLGTALNSTDPQGNAIIKNTIKTLPECGTLYYKDSAGAEQKVVINQALTLEQSKTLFMKPNEGSQGKSCTFTYTSTSSLDLESEPATVTVKLKSQIIEKVVQQITPVVQNAIGGQYDPNKNCTITGKLKQPIDVTACFDNKYFQGKAAEYYRISNLNTGKESCGDFFIIKSNGDRIRISEGQDITLVDSKIQFSPNASECKYCSDIGFDVTPYTATNEALTKYQVIVKMEDCAIDTIRTGGFAETIRENLVLLMILIASIVFFFTTITSEQVKIKKDAAKE